MKIQTRTVLSLVSLASLSLCATARAESSVSLYGTLDAGIYYSSNQGGSHVLQFVDSSVMSSTWGITGTEDLGDGRQALFKLASFFRPATGQQTFAGKMFSQYAYVGLADERLGTVTLGRQLDVVGNTLWNFTAAADWGGTLYAHPYDNDNAWGTFWVNNAVNYQSAPFAGFQFSGMYAFSNKAGDGNGSGFADNRLWGMGVSWSLAALKAALVYEQLDNPGNDLTATTGAVDLVDANFRAARQRIFGAGLSYDFDKVSLRGNVTRSQMSNPLGEYQNAAFTGAPSMSFNNFEIDALYHVSPSLDIGGSYTYTIARVAGASPHWNQAGMMAQYHLSKRTSVYLNAVWQRVHGDGSEFSHAQLNGLVASSSESQGIAGIGMKHVF
ncbi:porin [Paraburkholderia sp. J67]|uniref:porin n=1 Tax=Paraburkholderia sp. J67 TaxID=2805435 RepID=UPI002ABD8B64|nr:porin [Paraburkholderia sp. J67]